MRFSFAQRDFERSVPLYRSMSVNIVLAFTSGGVDFMFGVNYVAGHATEIV